MTNQKQVKHTALPWDRDGYNLSSVLAITNVSALGNRNYQHICDCNFGQEGKLEYAEINMANAAFIVKCVNSHDKLVEALKIINELAPSTCQSKDDTCCCIKCIAQQALEESDPVK